MMKIPLLVRMNKILVASVDIFPEGETAYLKVKKGLGKSARIRANEESFIYWIRKCYGVGTCSVVAFAISRSRRTKRRIRVNKRFWKGLITERMFKRLRDPMNKNDYIFDETTNKWVKFLESTPCIISKYLKTCRPVFSWHNL